MEESETIQDSSSYYALLNVANDASEEAIRRSYRQLAQIFHPDKAEEGLQGEASTNFMRIQEAYEVLSNEEKRCIYDVYGKKGLQSGLEVGEYLRQPEEIRKEFERLKAQEKSQRREASVAHRGHYIFKVDACDTMDPYDTDVDHMPELISVFTTNSVQLPLSDKLAASVGCQVGVKKRVGGGSFVCGIRRIVGKDDIIEAQAAIGLKQFASVDFRRQLGERTSATVSTSFQPQAGWGLNLSTTRKLTSNWDADLMYQVGPDSLLAFGVTRRGLKTFLSARFEIGMSTGVIWKAVWQATDSISLRMSAKFGTMGMELELGGTHRLTEFSSTGCAVTAGLQGVVVKPRFSRGGHVFEMPIMVSPHLQDYKILMAAYILPPTIGFVVKFCIVKPLKRRAKLQKVLAEREEKLAEIQAAVRTAQLASASLQGIATRKFRSEADQAGLVVLNAKYGAPEAIKIAEAQELQTQTANGDAANGNHHGIESSPLQASGVSDSDDEFGAEIQRAVSQAP